MQSLFDFRQLVKTRDAIAGDYRAVSVFQQAIESELLSRLEILKDPVQSVAVLGGGNQNVLAWFCQRFPDIKVSVIDISERMLETDRHELEGRFTGQIDFLITEKDQLPLSSQSVDLVFSNMFLALSDDVASIVRECLRVLRGGGCLHFSLPGPHTFSEIRYAWKSADSSDHYHAIEFSDMHDVGDVLVASGFADPVMDCEQYFLTYSTAASMFEDMRKNGVRNYFGARRKGLTGRRKWQGFLDALAQNSKSEHFSLTVEAVLGQAWKPLEPAQRRLDDGSVQVPLETLRSGHQIRRQS